MKKLLTFIAFMLCVLCMALGFAACGENSTDNTGNGGTQTEQPGGDTGGNQGGTQTEQPGGGEMPHEHSFTNYVYNEDATCLEDGTETATCVRCSEQDTREAQGSALGHDYQQYEEKGPTCSEAGNKAYEVCRRCNDSTLTEEDYIPALHVQYHLENGSYTALALSDDCADNEMVIPSSYMGKPVASIAPEMFKNCTWLQSVTIPESIILIGKEAFYGCSGLRSVVWNAENCSDDYPPFEGCTSLRSVTFGENVKTIPACAFSGCSGLTEIVLPQSITSIGREAFVHCSGLTGKLFIPENVSRIDYGAFAGCGGFDAIEVSDKNTTYRDEQNCLIETSTGALILGCRNSTIPDNVTSIESFAFYGCSGLTSVTIPESVTSIGSGVFDDCDSLERITVNEKNPKYSGQDGILYNKAKTDFIHVPRAIQGAVIIPTRIGSIPSEAFRNCNRLTSVTIGRGVTSIGAQAFAGCSGLTSITIPDNVTSIGERAFAECNGLTEITIPFVGNGLDNTHFYYLFGYDYSAVPMMLKKVTITGGTSIGERAFAGCSGLTSVNIGNGVTSIGEWAFSGCSGLTSVNIGNNVTAIGWSAFYGCSGLTSVTIGSGVTAIGDYAFRECSGLTSVTIPESVTSIGDGVVYGTAYYNNNNNWTGDVLYIGNHLIKTRDTISGSYSIRGGTKTIADYAFSGCQKLTSIIIPDSVTSIGWSAFKSCNELISVTIGSGVTSIGSSAFLGCQKLTSIDIPDSVTSIGDDAFYGCSGLTEITIPDSVTSIGEGAFYGCSGLTEIKVNPNNQTYHAKNNCLIETKSKTLIAGCKTSEIPDDGSVTSIGKWAFAGCRGLTSVEIPDSVTSIGEYAFAWCTRLTSVTIGSGVTSIESCAFSGCDGLQSVTFRDPNGWSCDNSEVDVTILQNAAAAAEFVKSHGESTWTK